MSQPLTLLPAIEVPGFKPAMKRLQADVNLEFSFRGLTSADTSPIICMIRTDIFLAFNSNTH